MVIINGAHQGACILFKKTILTDEKLHWTLNFEVFNLIDICGQMLAYTYYIYNIDRFFLNAILFKFLDTKKYKFYCQIFIYYPRRKQKQKILLIFFNSIQNRSSFIDSCAIIFLLFVFKTWLNHSFVNILFKCSLI